MPTVTLNSAISTPAGRAPDWIQLLPDGPDIVGMDGRRWRNDHPHQVAMDCRMPMVLDYEHASELRAPQGLPAPAAGWIDRLEIRGASALWGHVDWTDRARQQIQNREYRYLSPVFLHEKDSGRIVRLTSVGLTNQPNLPMTALNRVANSGLPDPDPLYAAAQQTFAQVASIRRAFRTVDAFFSHLKSGVR